MEEENFELSEELELQKQYYQETIDEKKSILEKNQRLMLQKQRLLNQIGPVSQ